MSATTLNGKTNGKTDGEIEMRTPYSDTYGAFDELCSAMGTEAAMEEIIDAMSTDTLGDFVEFVARMNDIDLSEFE